MKHVKYVSLMFAVLMLCGGTQAAFIEWEDYVLAYDAVDETAWVSQDGDLVCAINASSSANETVNYAGIDWFNANNTEIDAGVTQNGITITAGPGDQDSLRFTTSYGAGLFTGDPDNFYSGGIWRVQSLTLSGLTPGVTYQLQIMCQDERYTTERWTTLGDGTQSVSDSVTAGTAAGCPITTNPAGQAGAIIGTFKADSSTQTIDIYGSRDSWDSLNNGSTCQFNALQLRSSQVFGAHTPEPADDSTVLSTEVPDLTEVSWYSPLQDVDGLPVTDSNILTVDNYDVYIYAVATVDVDLDDDPNFVGMTAIDNDQNKSMAIPFEDMGITSDEDKYDKTYFWRVDTLVTFDSNEFLDSGAFSGIVEGKPWSFTTQPSYTPPAIDSFDNVITTLGVIADGSPADLGAVVSGNNSPILAEDVVFTLMTDDYQYPAGGSDAVLVNDDPMDVQNPGTTLTTTVPGTYKVKLVLQDTPSDPSIEPTVVEAVARVVVYEDECQAKKDSPSGWTAAPYDFNDDCLVDLLDFAMIAELWLNDTSMDVQEIYSWDVVTVPLEGDIIVGIDDVYSWTDPNYVSEAPLEIDAGGPRLVTNSDAHNGLSMGYDDVNEFTTYEIEIPETNPAGGPYTYTVTIRNAIPDDRTEPQAIGFGTVTPDGDPSTDNPTAYGTVDLTVPGLGWANEGSASQWRLDTGTIDFGAPGTHLVRMTFLGNSANLDYFTLTKD